MAKKEPAKKTSSHASAAHGATSDNGAQAGVAMTSGMTDDKVVMLTRKGYDELVNELDYLRNVKRREVADRIREAISYGDLSENSEYEESKNEQAFVEGRILELEEKVKYAKIIDEEQKRRATVQLGSSVWIRKAGATGVEQKFVIVGSSEADPVQSRISNVSPVGRALIDQQPGDVVRVEAPAGVIEYEILRVE